ncbi:MAG: hypothetical protein LBP34_03490 [Flavobacteriaceae bacterium]|jgi:hypothetical protein|nr:hypothetical protein [Flavobacteriaceae bacterium]
MKGITYKNTKTTLPCWIDPVHINQPRGYAYETDTHFVHFYGKDEGLYVISPGLTAIQAKNGTLKDWVINTFGAEDIEQMNLEVGQSIESVWRPSLYFHNDTFQALNVTKTEMRLVEQALRLLINRLDELFLYIEPDKNGLLTYSHKTRELLILACTEVENSWKYYMDKSSTYPINGKTFTTKDYIKLVDKLYLREFEFTLKTYSAIPAIAPFRNWDSANPTTSISWYNSYNKTKHDRDSHFSEATLINCIEAVVANLVMYCVRFSPFPLFDQPNTFSSLVNQHFDVRLINTCQESYYLHKIELPSNTRSDLFCYDCIQAGHTQPFIVKPLVL